MSEKNKPGHLQITKLVIRDVIKDRRKDLVLDPASFVPKFTIVESIDSPMIYGDMIVFDTTGILESYPLRGEEIIEMEIEDSLYQSDENIKNKRRYEFFLYKIDGVAANEQNTVLIYKVHFVTYQHFRASTRKITRAYKDKPITAIVSEIFNEFYSEPVIDIDLDTLTTPSPRNPLNSTLISTNTDGVVRCIIPNLTPPEALIFLNKRAHSLDNNSCSFRFFQNSDHFYFISDEELYKKSKDSPYTFSYGILTQQGPQNFIPIMNNLFSLQNPFRFDTFNDMFQGAYHNKVLEIDINKRKVNLYDEDPEGNTNFVYDVNDYQDDESKAGTYIERHSQEFKDEYFTPEIQKKFMFVKNYDDFESTASTQLRGESYFTKIIQNRTAYRSHLNSIAVQAVGPGRMDICAGDIVDLRIEELNGETEKRFVENKQLSGRYIVRDVSKSFDSSWQDATGRNYYTLMKRNWAREEDNT
jgi:hypothetical protein